MTTEILIFIGIVLFWVVVIYTTRYLWRKAVNRSPLKVCGNDPAMHRIALPEPIGFFYLPYVKLIMEVYEPVGWFKRLMLRWCFGFKYYSDMNERYNLN